MKILFFASDYKIGLSTLLTDQLIAFHQVGLDIYAVAGEKEQENGLGRKVKEQEIPIFRIDGLDEHKNFRSLAKILVNIIVHNKIQLIHVQNNWQLTLIAYIKYALLRNKNLKIVYTLHGFRHNNPWKAYIAQIIIGTALFLFVNHIICMSSYLKQKFRILSYKINLIPLGVPDSFTNSNYFVPSDNGLQMIFPAQFRHGKNQDIIIRAFAEHIKRNDDSESKLVLPGDGELLVQNKELANELGICDRVIFPGLLSKEDIRKLYIKSNIGIISSNSETFGQSIVEPFVLGRCIISTPVGITNDIIKKGENGYVYKTCDELIDILGILYKNQALIKEIGKRNFQQRDMFSWSSISKTYKEEILS